MPYCSEIVKLSKVETGHYVLDDTMLYIWKKVDKDKLQLYTEFTDLVDGVKRIFNRNDIVANYANSNFTYITGDIKLLKKFLRKHNKNLIKELKKRGQL